MSITPVVTPEPEPTPPPKTGLEPVLDLPLSPEDLQDILDIGTGTSSNSDALDTAIQYLKDL